MKLNTSSAITSSPPVEAIISKIPKSNKSIFFNSLSVSLDGLAPNLSLINYCFSLTFSVPSHNRVERELCIFWLRVLVTSPLFLTICEKPVPTLTLPLRSNNTWVQEMLLWGIPWSWRKSRERRTYLANYFRILSGRAPIDWTKFCRLPLGA